MNRKPQAAPAMMERELAGHIVRAAKESGWLVARTWLSKFSPAGEPDLRMVKVGSGRIAAKMVVAELKGEKGVVSPAQREWLDALSKVPCLEVYCWRPADLEQVYLLLLGQANTLKRWETM